jgi:hypothetical protein
MGTMVKKSKGVAAYILVEDDAGALKKANKQIDDILQCFWVIEVQLLQYESLMVLQIENLIGGGLVLNDVLQTVKDQNGWMSKLCFTVDRHFKVCSSKIHSFDVQ